MLDLLLPSFSDELQKLAGRDWKEFEEGLASPAFRKKELKATDDPKLKKYIRNVGGAISSKELRALVQSSSDLKNDHTVKVLPGGRFSCTCKDWQYKHSVGNTDCKHIERYRLYLKGLIKERR